MGRGGGGSPELLGGDHAGRPGGVLPLHDVVPPVEHLRSPRRRPRRMIRAMSAGRQAAGVAVLERRAALRGRPAGRLHSPPRRGWAPMRGASTARIGRAARLARNGEEPLWVTIRGQFRADMCEARSMGQLTCINVAGYHFPSGVQKAFTLSRT